MVGTWIDVSGQARCAKFKAHHAAALHLPLDTSIAFASSSSSLGRAALTHTRKACVMHDVPWHAS